MTILVSGCAGFIGFHLSKKLLEAGNSVIGIDSLNEYYDIAIKKARLKELGVENNSSASVLYSSFTFHKIDMNDTPEMEAVFASTHFDVVCNLAAQPGVRYSIDNPRAYIDSNINGFFNILHLSNKYKTGLFLYASSSSVYGDSKEIPFTIDSDTSHPVSFYAATKKTNELLAHTYSHLFKLKTIGVRFFTVYGPWGRPDMAYYSFTKNIVNGKPISLYNMGNLKRDFTYIDDIISGLLRIIESGEKKISNTYSLYNIGNNEPVTLGRFVKAIEKATGKNAIINYLPMQPGDVEMTYADISALKKDFDFTPYTSIEEGIQKFTEWYLNYHNAELK